MKTLSLIAVLIFNFTTVVQAQRGKIFETRSLKSEILNMERKYAIYLPAGYDESDQSYPVLYLLHGAGGDQTEWVQFGQVEYIANRVIAEGLACPMIIVMPNAKDGTRGYFNAIQGNFNYEDYFFNEFIPHIEKTYRVRGERHFRAVAGASMGGGGALYYAFHRPDIFVAAAPMAAGTGYWEFEQFKKSVSDNNLLEKQLEDYFNRHSVEAFLKNASEEDMKKIKSISWYICCGDDDPFYEGSSKLHIAFRKNEIRHEYRVRDGGHTAAYFRMELAEVIEFVSKSFTRF